MLKPRLKEIYHCLNNCNHIVDVGSDHGYLSIALVQNNKCNFVTNIDINSAPLLVGQNNAIKLGLGNKINFCLNNGLKGIKLEPLVDAISISGMGANNIISIIQNNNDNIPIQYVVQANNNSFQIREFIKQMDYFINNEIIVMENKITYEIISFVTNKKNNLLTDTDIHIGPILKLSSNVHFKEMLINKYIKLKKIVDLTKNASIINHYQVIKSFLYEKKWIS